MATRGGFDSPPMARGSKQRSRSVDYGDREFAPSPGAMTSWASLGQVSKGRLRAVSTSSFRMTQSLSRERCSNLTNDDASCAAGYAVCCHIDGESGIPLSPRKGKGHG